MQDKTFISLELPVDLKRATEMAAAANGISRSEAVRQAIEKWLAGSPIAVMDPNSDKKSPCCDAPVFQRVDMAGVSFCALCGEPVEFEAQEPEVA